MDAEELEELEGAVGGVVEEHHEGTSGNCPSDSSNESQRSTQSQAAMRWVQMKRKDKINLKQGAMGTSQAETHLRQEESSDSDSDGGWDFETGGMPLLPR